MSKAGWGRASRVLIAVLATPVLGVLVYLGSSDAADRGGFPAGPTALLVVLLLDTAVSDRWFLRSLREWLWTLVPFVGFLILDERATSAATQAAMGGPPGLMSAYVLSALEFVVFVLAWLVVSPGGGWLVVSPKQKPRASLPGAGGLPWRLIVLLVGAVPVVFGTLQAHKILSDPSIAGPEQFHSIQSLLIEAGCFLYVLVLVREMLLRWASKSARAARDEAELGAT